MWIFWSIACSTFDQICGVIESRDTYNFSGQIWMTVICSCLNKSPGVVNFLYITCNWHRHMTSIRWLSDHWAVCAFPQRKTYAVLNIERVHGCIIVTTERMDYKKNSDNVHVKHNVFLLAGGCVANPAEDMSVYSLKNKHGISQRKFLANHGRWLLLWKMTYIYFKCPICFAA